MQVTSTFSAAALAADPVSPATLYAGSGGVAKSEDEGLTWSSFVSGIPAGACRALLLDASVPETVYTGSNGEGIFKSLDGAVTWRPLSDGLPPMGSYYFEVYALALGSSTPRILFAGTETGVYARTETYLPGDCNQDGEVSIGMIQRAVNMFMGLAPPGCAVDVNGDGQVSIGEVLGVVNGFRGRRCVSCGGLEIPDEIREGEGEGALLGLIPYVLRLVSEDL